MTLETRDGYFYQFYPPDMRPRTPRSPKAQEVGRMILAHAEGLYRQANASTDGVLTNEEAVKVHGERFKLWTKAYSLTEMLSVVFGIKNPKGHDWGFSFLKGEHPQNTSFPLAEFEPKAHDGFLAAIPVDGLEEILRPILQVSPETLDGHHLGDNVVVRSTYLTESDGIVWAEVSGKNGLPDRKMLLVFLLDKG